MKLMLLKYDDHSLLHIDYLSEFEGNRLKKLFTGFVETSKGHLILAINSEELEAEVLGTLKQFFGAYAQQMMVKDQRSEVLKKKMPLTELKHLKAIRDIKDIS